MSKVYRVAVREIEIEVEEAGQGARAFVLVHGFTGSRDDWKEQIPELAPLGRTLALDNRGHGGSTNSGRAEDYTTQGMSEDLLGVLDALDLEQVDLLGHSLGGLIAQRFVLAHPERVSSLVLMDTAGRSIGNLFPPALRDSLAAFVRANGVGAMVPRMREGAARGPRPAAAAKAEARMGPDVFWGRIQCKLDAMDPVAWDTLSQVLSTEDPMLPRLGAICVPTLVMVGAEDTPFLTPSDELAAAIPGARLCVIPDAAHSPQHENPGAWFAAIRAHLALVRG